MLTTRISPKMSEKPLATMKSRPANVSPSSTVATKAPGSSNAEPMLVVRQLTSPYSPCGFVITRT